MTVRCKFKCVMAEPMGDGFRYRFEPVYSGSEENEKFFSLTPFGQVDIGIVQKRDFVVGEEYYLDFTSASTPQGKV